MIERITLLGSSSGRNAGDAALISGIMDSIDKATQSRLLYEIPTIKPEFIWRSYENRVRPVSMLPWHGSVKMFGIPTYQSVMRTDLSLIFDAILFDRALYNPLFNFLSTLSLLLPHAKKRGKRLGCFNVGVGPVDTPRGRDMLRDLLELMDFITVRDESSAAIVRDIGVKNPNVLVTADAALSVTPSSGEKVTAILQKLGLGQEKEILALNVSSYLDSWSAPGKSSMGVEAFTKVYAEGVSRAVEKLNVPVLFVCTQHSDVPLSRGVLNAIRSNKKALVSNIEYSHYDIKGVLQRMSLLFGMRLHAVILASSELTPVCALPHQPKVVHYLKTLGLEQYAMSFEKFTPESIEELITRSWAARAETRRQLETRVPAEKSKAILAADLVASLRRGEDVGAAIERLKISQSGGAPAFDRRVVQSLLG